MGSPTNRHRPARSGLPPGAATFACGALFGLLFMLNVSLFVSYTTRNDPPSTPSVPRAEPVEIDQLLALEPTTAPPTQQPVAVVREVSVVPSAETWPMQEDFYTSTFPTDDTSTTIIFNLFKGPAEALRIQLEAATRQRDVAPPEIWVMCFNSPLRREYEAVVDKFKADTSIKSKIVFTVSDFNHKFHGRFLLAYMAKTKYVLIVDDDRNIDETTVADCIRHMKMKPGVWGNLGHLRAPTFDSYKHWPKYYWKHNMKDLAYVEMDYLSGLWFLQQSWLEYFVKERMPSWETSEDMHLSHVMRKYLNLNTYGGRIALWLDELPKKKHAATVGKALELREYIFDHQLGRGNKVANVDQPIDTLVYGETVGDILTVVDHIESCQAQQRAMRQTKKAEGEAKAPPEDDGPWCHVGRAAAVFRGAKEQDVVGLIDAAQRLCAITKCEYAAVKPKIKHPIRYFNMREGYGQSDTELPWQTSATDVLMSFVGILNNVLPMRVILPDVSESVWVEEATDPAAAAVGPRKKNRLQIYHDTLQLAISIHVNSPTNHKWDHRTRELEATAAYPSEMEVFTWKHAS